MLLHCGPVCGGGVREGTISLFSSCLAFSHFPLLPTSILGPSGADSRVDVFVYVLGPCGSLQQALLWGWEFLPPPQPPQIFSVRHFEALFPCAGPLGCLVSLAPQLFFLVYAHTNVGPLLRHLQACLPRSSSHLFALSPLHPTCQSSPFLACLHPSYWSGWMFLL